MTMGAFLLFAQATSAVAVTPSLPGPTPPPDIEIRARFEAREVMVDQEGRVAVTLRPEASSSIEVRRSQPAGARTYRNLTIDARVAAMISLDDDGTLIVSTTGSTGEQPQ